MHKRSLLIYGAAVVVLIAVGGLIWYLNRSSADIPLPGGGSMKAGMLMVRIKLPDDTPDNNEDNKPAAGAVAILYKDNDGKDNDGNGKIYDDPEVDFADDKVANKNGLVVFRELSPVVYDKLRAVNPENPSVQKCYLLVKEKGPVEIKVDEVTQEEIILEEKAGDYAALLVALADGKTLKTIGGGIEVYSPDQSEPIFEKTASDGSIETDCEFEVGKKITVRGYAPGHEAKDQEITIAPGVNKVQLILDPKEEQHQR